MRHMHRLIAVSASAILLASCGGGRAAFTPQAPLASAPESYAGEAYAAGVKDTPDFRDLGRAPRNLSVRLAVVLRYRHQSELDVLVRAQSDRTSPSFRHYLTNDEFAAYFSPSEREYRQVVQTLTAAGLKIADTFRNRTVVVAAGSSSAVERLFSTQIDYGTQDGHGARYKNVTDAMMPPSLRNLVFAVMGLDDLVEFAPHERIVYPAVSDRSDPSHLRGPNGELGPLGFQRAYDEPSLHGYDGTGRAIANTFPGDINSEDLRVFLRYFGIKPAHPLRRITVDGGNLHYGSLETTLDIEAMIGTAPGAQVYLYSFNDFLESDAVEVYNKVVDDNLVDAVNSSWGGCESYNKKKRLGHFYAEAANKIFEQGAAKGMTFAIATGDFGWKTCSHHGFVNITTADDAPHAIAIGGTNLFVNKNGYWMKETAWHRSDGGVSIVFPVPEFQEGVHHIVGAGRNIPDVSFDANPHEGFAERWHHIWVGAGGTSLGSPLWCGLEAQMDQYLGTRIGFVNPQVYSLLVGPSYKAVFHDIKSGNNGGYNALPGYDLVTGIGTPIGWPLAQALK